MPGGYRRYCFTINDCDQGLQDTPDLQLDASAVRYAVYQLERAPDTGHLHIQGYFELNASRSRGKAAQLLPGKPHMEKANGSRDQCVAYCSKDDSRVGSTRVFGEPPAKGQRSDLASAISALKSERALNELVDDLDFACTYAKYTKGMDKLRALYKRSPYRPEIRVYVLAGPTGTGKTRFALSRGDGSTDPHPSVFKKAIGTKWFDGYDGQSRLVLDEFTGWLPFQQLLQITDLYPLDIEAKGYTIPAEWIEVFITTNKFPRYWYSRDRHWPAFVRRVTAWVYCGTETEWVWYDSFSQFEFEHLADFASDDDARVEELAARMVAKLDLNNNNA